VQLHDDGVFAREDGQVKISDVTSPLALQSAPMLAWRQVRVRRRVPRLRRFESRSA
jgi:hypothetical protein